MWTVDQEKENAKSWLKANLTSSITNTMAFSNDIHDMVSIVNALISGVPSGQDRQLDGCCQRSLSSLSRASGLLHQSLNDTGALEAMKWVEDDRD